jgi:hypothetical protein
MNMVFLVSIVAAMTLSGCGGQKQEQKTSLYEAAIPVDASGKPARSYTENLEIGPDGKRVPIRIAWSSKPDKAGCWKISQIKVSRQGGDPGTVISAVKHTAIPNCAMKFDSEDETRFQTFVISAHYESTTFMKVQTFDGSISLIQGNGEFIPTLHDAEK